jgi:hypothetical protein
MTTIYTHARFWKCALQVNPAGYSSAYRGQGHGLNETAYNQALLAKCQELDIKVVGIADHGNVDAIDALCAVLEPAGIVVFPGFEIASNDKTHYVCLFAEGTTRSQLDRYLGALQLLDPSDGVRPSQLSSDELIDEVGKLGGFIYAAHCTNDSGLLKNRLSHVWRNPALRAVQVPGSVEDLKSIEDDFYRKAILNKNTDYLRERTIAVINAKDAAKPDDLAESGATCLIKMTKPSFEAFKSAFFDPESRIRLNSDAPEQKPAAFLAMRVTGGYLDGVAIEFSAHLNTVIGGRGTGKSTNAKGAGGIGPSSGWLDRSGG